MFNALWFNAQELNGSGMLQRIIALESAASAGAAVEGALARRKGLGSNVSAGANNVVTLARGRTMATAVGAGAYLIDAAAMSPRRMLGAEAFVLTYAVLGAGFAKLMAADANVTVTGIMYPYAALLEAEVTAGASTADPVLTRTRQFGGAVLTCAAVLDLAPLVYRQCFAEPHCGAVAVASPDYIQGGVRQSEFGSTTTTGADAECVIDPTKFLHADAFVLASGYVAPVVNRYVHFQTNPQLATVVANFPGLQAVRLIAGLPVSLGATTTAALRRDAYLAPVPRVAGANANTPRLSRYIRLVATNGVIVDTAPTRLDHFRGLSAEATAGATSAWATPIVAERFYAEAFVSVQASMPLIKNALRLEGEALCGISGVGAVDVKLAVRLAAAATGGATALSAGYFTTRMLVGQGMLTISTEAVDLIRRVSFASEVDSNTTAIAQVWVNLYQFEPDYRTLEVEAEDTLLEVDPQDFEIIVTDDGVDVKTFQKQPREVLAYDIDLAAWFAGVAGDDIETADCEVMSATSGAIDELSIENIVIIGSQPLDAGSPAYRVKVWLSGGLDGVTYKLRATIDTEGGRRKEVDFKLKIKDV